MTHVTPTRRWVPWLIIIGLVASSTVPVGGRVIAAPGSVAMFRVNPAHTGEQPGPLPRGNPVMRWRFQTNATLSGSPTVVDGSVYLGGDDGVIYAIDAEAGYARWGRETRARAGSSPAVIDDLVYATNGDLSVFETATGGSPLSIQNNRISMASPLTVVGDTLFVGGSRGNSGGFFGAYDREIGINRWRFDTPSAAIAAPAVADGRLFGGTLGYDVYALDAATGERLWSTRTDGAVTAAPAYADGVVYVRAWGNPVFVTGGAIANVRGMLYAFDAATGAERWRLTTDAAADSSPAIVDGVIYFGGGRAIYAVDAKDGSIRWRVETGLEVLSSPGVVDGVVVVGSHDGSLYALDAATGDELWRFETDAPIASSPTVVGGAIYFTSGKSLYAIGDA